MATNGTRRKALVTGASAGIGEAFARRLARDGYDLVLVARRQDRLDALAGELGTQHGVRCETLRADLAAREDCESVAARLRAGGIDLLVNNAGFGAAGEFAELPLDRQLEEIDVNVRALTQLTHAALGPMIARGDGQIINVGSTAAFQPIPYTGVYAATKAYVLHFTEAVHEEVRRQGVSVTCLCPGPVRTEFQQVSGVDNENVPAFVWTDVDMVVGAALAAVRANRAIVVPGAANLAGVATTKWAPRFVTRRIAGAFFQRRT